MNASVGPPSVLGLTLVARPNRLMRLSRWRGATTHCHALQASAIAPQQITAAELRRHRLSPSPDIALARRRALVRIHALLRIGQGVAPLETHHRVRRLALRYDPDRAVSMIQAIGLRCFVLGVSHSAGLVRLKTFP